MVVKIKKEKKEKKVISMETQMRTSKSLLTQLLCLEHYSNEISTLSGTIIILSPSPFSSYSY